ncbi:hypothetical protein A9Q99_15540 [Gammaproteobacteria bacterium 45_16_T64]|nr:hypothetical protein A9Q99_15540 [Gammaproteobacteria bacterium 45_16_T64]
MFSKKLFGSMLVISLATSITGCVSLLGLGLNWDDINQHLKHRVVNKASFEHDCPKADIQVTQIDGYTFGAKGCGSRSTYILIPDQRCGPGIWSEKYIDTFCKLVTNSRR